MRRTTDDALRRLTGLYVDERLAEQIIYGERQGHAANHRGQVFQHFDGAAVVTNVAFDFKKNLIQRRCALRSNDEAERVRGARHPPLFSTPPT